MKRKDWFIKYSLEFIVIVLGISVSFWLNQVSTNKQNNNERIKVLNNLQIEAKEINVYCAERKTNWQNDVEILLISTDRRPRSDVSLFLDKMEIFEPQRGFDPQAVWARQLKVSALPVTFLINASQTKCVFFMGIANWSKPEVIKAVKEQLALLN